MTSLLLEHHGKTLLRRYGIECPSGVVVADATGPRAASTALRFPVVLKAQVPVGGRGKAGGVLVADNPDAALDAAQRLLGMSVKGHDVDAVLVEERVAVQAERYAAVMVRDGELVLLFGRTGGVDIEAITAEHAGNLESVVVDPLGEPDRGALVDCFRRLGYPEEAHDACLRLASSLHALCRDCDALLVEINPLGELPAGGLLALDARIAIDPDALPRQPAIAAMLGSDAPAGSRRPVADLVRFRRNPSGGSIGLVGIGSGLNLTIMDWIDQMGGRAASLVDVDPAAMTGRAGEGFRLAFDTYDRDVGIKAILVNVITAGYRLDDLVAALVPVLETRLADKPVVLHLYGNAMDDTPRMLARAGCRNAASLGDAVRQVVAAGG